MHHKLMFQTKNVISFRGCALDPHIGLLSDARYACVYLYIFLRCCVSIATDNTPLKTMQLTDEDKSLLERWQQMQQQRSVSSTVSTASSETTMTPAAAPPAAATTTSTTTGDCSALQLSSSDSRLADQCLADTHLIWTPSISLSSADIASCLQARTSSTQTTAAAAAEAADGGCATRCCAGYGVGEMSPSCNKYICVISLCAVS